MIDNSINANCLIEEVPVIGNMAVTFAERDQEHIATMVPDYTPDYFAALRAKQAVVENLVSPQKVTQEMKEVTRRLYANMETLKGKLNLLEIQINRAKGSLTVSPASFKLSALRKNINTKNAEGILQNMKYILGLVDDNMEALGQKGMTQEQRDEYAAISEQIKNDNLLQSTKLSSRRSLTQDNITTINDYLADVMEMMNTLKLVYKGNPAKVKDYTFTALRRMVRAESKKNAAGEVMEALPEPLPGPLPKQPML